MLIGEKRRCAVRARVMGTTHVFILGDWYVLSDLLVVSSRQYACYQISEGKARSLIQKYDVKKRLYYGNTSMDAEVSLLMANQALVSTLPTLYDVLIK